MTLVVKNTYQFFGPFGKFEYEAKTKSDAIEFAESVLSVEDRTNTYHHTIVVVLPNAKTHLYLNEWYCNL